MQNIDQIEAVAADVLNKEYPGRAVAMAGIVGFLSAYALPLLVTLPLLLTVVWLSFGVPNKRR